MVIATARLAKSSFSLRNASSTNQHGIVRFRCATAVGGNEAERFVKAGGRTCESASDPVRVGVVDEIDLHRVAARVPEGVGHKHRAKGRSADANGQHVR